MKGIQQKLLHTWPCRLLQQVQTLHELLGLEHNVDNNAIVFRCRVASVKAAAGGSSLTSGRTCGCCCLVALKVCSVSSAGHM